MNAIDDMVILLSLSVAKVPEESTQYADGGVVRLLATKGYMEFLLAAYFPTFSPLKLRTCSLLRTEAYCILLT